MLQTDFSQPLVPPWRVTEIGRGQVTQSPGALRLSLPSTPAGQYSDAQITDYAGKPDFRWRPPLRLTITAHFELGVPDMHGRIPGYAPTEAREVHPELATGNGQLVGTAGFGFWNHPFVPGERGFRLPSVAWFFFSAPPSNMALADGVPGPGWKAATLDATRPQFLALAPTAPIGILLTRIPALYRRLWPVGQRALGVSEGLLDTSLLFERHTYTLDWRRDSITFAVDGAQVHRTPSAPRGPMGFIAWIDNQYAVVTPQGRFAWGLVPVAGEQTLVIDSITIE
jgi:hypothetical protein